MLRAHYILVISLLCHLPAWSGERVYEAEGSFAMGDGDTKQEAQREAFLSAKASALEEAGVYIESVTRMLTSETDTGESEEFDREIRAITAGVAKVADEDVTYTAVFDAETGTVTWSCRLRARIEEDSVAKQIGALRSNERLVDQLAQAEQQNTEYLAELASLREELISARQSTASDDDSQSRRIQALAARRSTLLGNIDANELISRASQAESDGRFREAIPLYRQALSLDPSLPYANLNLGVALAVTGELQEAQRYFRKAIQSNPESAVAHYNLGLTLDKLGRRADAIVRYREAIRLDPDYSGAYNNLALALGDVGDSDGELEALQNAVRTDPENATALYNLGISQGQNEDWPGAAATFERVATLQSQNAKAFYHLGYAMQKVDSNQEALTAYRRAEELGLPPTAGMHFNMALLLSGLGDTAGAESQYRRAIQIDPSYRSERYRSAISYRRRSDPSQSTLSDSAVTAAASGDFNRMIQLVQAGAGADAVDDDGYTLLAYASAAGRLDAIAVLVRAGASVNWESRMTPLHWASHGGHVRAVEFLVENGARLEAASESGLTALTTAASRGHAPAVRTLIRLGADTEAKGTSGMTPIQYAAVFGYEDVIAALVEGGADLHSRAENGRTALHTATHHGNTSAVDRLLALGANPNTADRWGRHSLIEAAIEGHAEIARLLVSGGAAIELADGEGMRAADHARENGHNKLYRLLKREDRSTKSKGS
jgi:ankyrin repeat protein/Flp pilus assembly protein TadD